ncbi:MAG TPA: excinuclease ABC subunit UvrC [Candidatus Saccharimonadales bacterium]|nr:excinuclease ABC subunit UvrC [Candidatus Saccharimonadales bacterium]
MPATEAIRKKIGALPHKPGVYLMRDRFGTVIYVGKARDLRKRVSQYFHPSRRMGWDLKFNALVEAISDFDFHVVKSDPEAYLLEGKLIKEFHPRYNVSFRDDKRFLMLKVNLNDPIPNFAFARFRKDDGARYFGPFSNSGALRNTLALVRRQFNLRGCRAFTPGENDYKHCLYAHLKYCTAPCIGNVTREQYLEQVNAACDFIEGQCAEMKEQLEVEMKKAALNQDYEKAADLRDLIRDLKETTKKTERFERVPYTLPLSIDPQRDLRELARALGLCQPPQRIEGFDISNISGTFAVASLVSFKNGRPDRANYRRFKIKTVEGQDDFASMAEVVKRRYTRILNEFKVQSPKSKDADEEAIPQELQKLFNETSRRIKQGRARSPGEPRRAGDGAPCQNMPDLILIDGGKGQLNAACEELKKLGLEKIPVIGLAKEFEEIYQPGETKPLRLGLDHPAVKLLQRIRDECHRVANSYNAQLRIKRISESILDEFPGIGERRKQALLKKFGSVQRLKTATLEQIGEVPGFGGKAAEELKKFLEARSVAVP